MHIWGALEIRGPASPSHSQTRPGLPSTFPRGLLGVLMTRALVRVVNLLASSAGSSCQLLLEARLPAGVGPCEERNTTLRGVPPSVLHPGVPAADLTHRPEWHEHRAAACHARHGFVAVEEGFQEDDLGTEL